jgi:hypothetical protein
MPHVSFSLHSRKNSQATMLENSGNTHTHTQNMESFAMRYLLVGAISEATLFLLPSWLFSHSFVQT